MIQAEEGRGRVNVHKQSEYHEGGEVNVLKKVTTMQTFISYLYDEVHIDLFRIEVLNEFVGSLCRSTGSQQIVVNKYHIVFIDRVEVHLNGVNTILLREAFLNDG